MKIEVENLEGYNRKLVIEIPSEDVDARLERFYSNVRKEADLKGFRKGKAPIATIKQLYRENAIGRTTQSLVEETLYKALEEKALVPIETPKIEAKVLKEGSAFEYAALFECEPPVIIKKFAGIKIKQVDCSASADQIKDTLDSALNTMAEYKEISESRGLQKGDFADMDYQASENGQPFDAASDKNSLLEVGTGALAEDFEKGILGMKAGEEKDITVKFPDAKSEEEKIPVSGKTLQFHIKVNGIKEKVLPELNDEFAKKAGPFKDLEDLRSRIILDIENQKTQQNRGKYREEFVAWLIKENPLDVSQTMINNQMQQLAMDAASQLQRQGLEQDAIEEKLKEWGDDLQTRAEHQVRASMLLGAISKSENIQATDEEFRKEVARLAYQKGRKPQEVLQELKDKGVVGGLLRQLTEIKTLDWLVDKALVTHDG